MRFLTPLAILQAKCDEWGGSFKYYPGSRTFGFFDSDSGVEEAPFTSKLGIIYEEKTICLIQADNLPWPYVLHEMAHVFACREKPNESDEGSFFGWEYMMAKKVVKDVPGWLSGLGDYYLEDGEDFSELPMEKKLKELQKAVAIGKKYGNLSSTGMPLAIR